MHLRPVLTLPALAAAGMAMPNLLEERQSVSKPWHMRTAGVVFLPRTRTYLPSYQCPNIHIFGARETTAPPGYGSSSTVVDLVLNAYPGSTAEALNYPACGGQSSCGGVSYANSANEGTANAASAINSFVASCPNTQIVLVGYSQVSDVIVLDS